MKTSHCLPPAPAWTRASLLAAGLWFCQPRSARAASSLSYEFSSYAEDANRIKVSSNYALAQTDLSPDMSLKIMGVTDSIAGATPTGALPQAPGDPVPTGNMTDHRHAASLDFFDQIKSVNLDLGYAVSRETDYYSTGWSINTQTDFNQKNTRLLLGYSGTADTIHEPILGWSSDRKKNSGEVIVGVTQLADPDDSLTVNLTVGRATGYLDDPYKIVSTDMLNVDPGMYYTVPENRPREKTKVSLYLGTNSNFSEAHGALETSYRFYHDTFGITSHTGTVRWLQNLNDTFTIEPSLRASVQSAASFYHYNLDSAGIVTSYDPTGDTGTGAAPYYSSDYRLSHMLTVDAGLKMTWNYSSKLSIDVSLDRYVMSGLDHVTPSAVYAKARIISGGFKYSF